MKMFIALCLIMSFSVFADAGSDCQQETQDSPKVVREVR
jgi:hypothetical protein